MSNNKDTFLRAANSNNPLRTKPAVMNDAQVRVLLSTHRNQLLKDLTALTIARQNATSEIMADRFEHALRTYRIRQYVHPSRFDDTDVLLNAANEYGQITNIDMLDRIFERLELYAQRLAVEPHQKTTGVTEWTIACKNTAFQIDRFKQWKETVFARAILDKHKDQNVAKQELIKQFINKKGVVSVQTIRNDSNAATKAYRSLSQPSWEVKRSKVVVLSAFR